MPGSPRASDPCETVGPLEAPILGAVALAAAIAFGWGARNVAQDIVKRAYNRRGEATSGSSPPGATTGLLLTASSPTVGTDGK